MMKKMVSIILSVLMLLSSSRIAYSQHFCGGMEMDSGIIVGNTNLSCGMEKMANVLHCDNENASTEAHTCCKNLTTKIKTDDTFAKASFDVKLNIDFVAKFVSVFVLHESAFVAKQKTFFADYNPPPLERDFTILYETFLI